MKADQNSIATCESLIRKLKPERTMPGINFFRSYGKIVRAFSIQTGLNETEADEIVQETVIGISRQTANYKHNPEMCRFKTWLLNQAT